MKHVCSKGFWLFLSVALNVFFIGMLLTHQPGGNWAPPHERIRAEASHLPAEQKKAVEAILAKYEPQLKAQWQKSRANREKLHDYMKSKDYDRAKADEKFEDMQEDFADTQDIMKAMMLDINDQLTPEQREHFQPFPPRRK